jgi:hypothetical protein
VKDFADRAWLLAEQSGLRCETPAPSRVPMVRHHPRVLRRQHLARLDAERGALVDWLYIAGGVLCIAALCWSC